MFLNDLIDAGNWRYESIDSNIWWPFIYEPIINTWDPNGRKITDIIRESVGPAVLVNQSDSSSSGNYKAYAVGPSNKVTSWNFYSTIFPISGTEVTFKDHGFINSDQYGKAVMNMPLVLSSGNTYPDEGILDIWAESFNYITYIDTISYIKVDPIPLAVAVWGDTVSGVYV